MKQLAPRRSAHRYSREHVEMEFMTLLGAVLAVLFHPGSASKINGQTICRSGTQRPCYKVSYIQDSRWRLTFEDAREACRSDGGELLSIETESEQRLIERFIQWLQPGDGDFWIGLYRSPRHHATGATSPGCPSQYYWLDGSKAKFRNWHPGEPQCKRGVCVVLYHQPSAAPERGRFLFQWDEDSCGSKNNFVCKYREEKAPQLADEGKTANTVPSLTPPLLPTTKSDERIKIEPPESSYNNVYVSYILYATVPALLLLMFAAAGFLCYKHHAKRRKTDADACPNRLDPRTTTVVPPCPVQGPYAFSDITKLPLAAPGDSTPVKYAVPSSQIPQCDHYENVSCTNGESGFVTNDIYEACRPQAGWVENEIYG
ncbi:chondrolectin isoform X1 [Betta splendens]|uniref:Chondrolectin isoform X1 n=1 Tax=Betta splendens TaxID=158456 RepID=A0A6P7P9M2_BETSP|nr:chondrolectin isoform X1 [Betta splendens]